MNDCPNCEYHRQRAQLWRDEAYKQAGHPLPEREQETVRLECVVCRTVYSDGVPPQVQRTWVGLTDEDELDWDGGDLKSLVKAIEARLKEKNNA